MLTTLYAANVDGSVQEWSIIVDGDAFHTKYGRVGGQIQISEPTVCQPKNVGKANSTTASQQAQIEAQAKWQKKIDSGFYEDLTLVNRPKFIEPMLAHKFEDHKHKMVFPVYVQPKLDGVRCIITRLGMFSRNGKPILGCPHILSCLADVFKNFPDLVLDGELYNHKYKEDFNKIISLVKKTKPTKNDLDESAKNIQYWVYDAVMPGLKFFSRMVALQTIWSKIDFQDYQIKLVDTFSCKNKKEIDAHYENFLAAGFEGQMVRADDIYHNKRTASLLKRKEFIDGEFEIVDVIEGIGNRAGMAGSFQLKNKRGHTFNANISGGWSWYEELWKNRAKLIGKMATIKYFNLTPIKDGVGGVPRFGVANSVREYE